MWIFDDFLFLQMPSRTSNNSSVTKVASTPQTMPAERHKYGYKKAPVNVQQGRMDGFNTIADKKVMIFVVNTATEKLQDKNKLEKIKKINLWKKL